MCIRDRKVAVVRVAEAEELARVADLPLEATVALTNTNCIESMISITRRTTGRVTKWKDGAMKKRWIAVGLSLIHISAGAPARARLLAEPDRDRLLDHPAQGHQAG